MVLRSTSAEASVAGEMGERTRVAIIGSGFAGLGLGIKLLERGERDFVILERAHDVGGVWRDNTYPGCACDVQSIVYSFSFAPNPAWTHAYPPQPEIQSYLQDCAERFGVTPHVRFGREVVRAEWRGSHWRVETRGRDGTVSALDADVLVSAVGGFSDPVTPELPGLSSFAGPVMHSSRWRHDVALAGKRVAVIGTGASAIQIVPAIQPEVARLTIFQRTAPWILPRHNPEISPRKRALYRRVPLAQRAARALLELYRDRVFLQWFRHKALGPLAENITRRYLERTVADPVLRAKLTPTYAFGCKRVLVSDDYVPAVTKPNVALVTDAIREVKPHAIVDAAGAEHAVDVIVFGTGFAVTEPKMARHVFGRAGRSLADVWGGSMQALNGTTIAGFPNYFVLSGPNTGTGHTSVIGIIEAQIEHVLGALAHLERARARGVTALEPTPEAQQRFVRFVDAKMKDTVWTSGGCASWYLDGTGRNSTLWPLSVRAFERRVARFHARDYVELTSAAAQQPAATARVEDVAPDAGARFGDGARGHVEVARA